MNVFEGEFSKVSDSQAGFREPATANTPHSALKGGSEQWRALRDRVPASCKMAKHESHFTDEEAEAQGDWGTCPRPHAGLDEQSPLWISQAASRPWPQLLSGSLGRRAGSFPALT